VSELDLHSPDLFSGRPFTVEEARRLETLAAYAWPAGKTEALDGWVLRFNHGVTRRANSVLPLRNHSTDPLEQQIETAEQFYRDHSLPPRFQITKAVQPDDLDAILERRGYVIEAPVNIQVAPIKDFHPGRAAADGEVSLLDRPNDKWAEIYTTGFGRKVLPPIPAKQHGQAIYPVFQNDAGETLGIGMGFLSGGWIGIFGMQTLHEHRGLGIGSALLMVFAAWGEQQGAHGLYLQLEHDNPGAERLYQRAGFKTVYGYHYRSLMENT